MAELYLNEASNIDLFNLFFGVRPSMIINNIFTNMNIKINNFKKFMKRICIMYDRVHRYVVNLKGEIFKIIRNRSFVPCSYFLKECLLLKWMIEVERVHVLKFEKKTYELNHMLVYLINANDVLIGELSNIIQKIVDTNLEEELKLLGLTNIPALSCMNDSIDFICYELNISSKHKYIIKIYELDGYDYLPSGLSTAYLNCKNEFQSLGYMGAVRIAGNEFKYLFLSVEEHPSAYLSTKDLRIFKLNVIQDYILFSTF